ncbi:hypothetical protein Taro_038092 [Colocasia esculenta]|uniref:Association with the SNF1 complex (ASC) domain-containing protein n=1 Tax=Colocasia esculenta TaxID=4460 RepID=A0A843W2F7_COLES|nr:hypothetical protein [Colocasia esculenta]
MLALLSDGDGRSKLDQTVYMRGQAREHPCALVDDFQRLPDLSIMSHHYGQDQEEINVVGFEVPRSPDSSYTNPIPGNEDEARDPPLAPSHLQHTLLSHPANRNTSSSLPSPENVILNHLYIENRESPRSVVALGFTHRFRSKRETKVLYESSAISLGMASASISQGKPFFLSHNRGAITY